MKNPCIECDNREKYNSFLEQYHSQIPSSKEPKGRPLLQRSFEQDQQSFLKYRHLFENAPDTIFVADAETGIILEANKKAAELLGIPADQIVGMHQSQLHPPEETQRYTEIFQEHIQNKSGYIPEDIYVCNKDGEKIPIQINASVAQFGDKNVIYGIFRDITQQNENETKLKASQERFKRLSESTFEGICIHDKGRIIDVNSRFLEMHGCGSVDEIKGTDCFNVIAPQSHEIVRQYMAAGEEGPYEAFNMKKDGTVFPVQIRARECQWEGKKVGIATFRDLTEQKQLEQQLKDSEQLYKDLYRNAKAALYRTRTSDGKLLVCSTVMAKMHGYDSIEECVEKHHGTSHYVDKNRRKQLLDKLHENKRVENFEYQIRRPDRTTVWLSLTAEIFPEQGWIDGMVTNITASKILTQTEMKILKVILTGKSNKEIAYGLGRSIRTVEDHRAHIMRKLGVENIVDLTRKALEYGITPGGE